MHTALHFGKERRAVTMHDLQWMTGWTRLLGFPLTSEGMLGWRAQRASGCHSLRRALGVIEEQHAYCQFQNDHYTLTFLNRPQC
jgi:hypothetical protein